MGLPLPPPSNCKRCHFRRPVELLWLYRFEREAYDEWVELEKPRSQSLPNAPPRGDSRIVVSSEESSFLKC